ASRLLPSCLIQFSPPEEAPNLGIAGFIARCPGIPVRNHTTCFGIQKNGIVSNRKNARQFMSHDDNGSTEALSRLKDEIIKQASADWIEARGWLVKEQDFRV